MAKRLNNEPSQLTFAAQEFLAELAEVEQQLRDATADLFPPFSQMVATQLRRSRPLRRAAVVLAAGVAAPDNHVVRGQRINLAAALEMLHLAITVHMILADDASTDAPNRSLLGSTILAGDYCFSRAASLAVRTGHSTVVEIFSDALKRVSEGHLRRFFNPAAEPYNEDEELFVAGATAAMHLAQTPGRAHAWVIQMSETFAFAMPEAAMSTWPPPPNTLDAYQSERWLALLNWHAAQS